MGRGSTPPGAVGAREGARRGTDELGPPPTGRASATRAGGSLRLVEVGERRVLPLLVWMVALVAGTATFHLLGDGLLAAPPLDPEGFSAWAAQREPLVATVAVLRLVVLALSWYLVGITSIGLLARLLRAARLVRVADALTVPVVRRLLQQALGVSLATAMVAAGTPTSASSTVTLRPDDAPAVTLTIAAPETAGVQEPEALDPPVDEGSGRDEAGPAEAAGRAEEGPGARDLGVSTSSGRPLEAEPEALRLLRDAQQAGALDQGRIVDDAAGATEAEAAEVTEAASDAATGADVVQRTDARVGSPPRPGAVHEVTAGESLWSIAEAALTHGRAVDGGAPTESEVVRYWRAVVAANQAELPDPDNPDLIFPGQRVHLPQAGA